VSGRLIAFLANYDISDGALDGVPSDWKASELNSQAASLLSPEAVTEQLRLTLAEGPQGKDGLTELLDRVLKTSLNTWDQGFMHKLYAGTNPVGVISELILAALNTNVSTQFHADNFTTNDAPLASRLLRITCSFCD